MKNIIKEIQKSGLFDVDWYLKKYPDVSKSNLNPIEHYIKFGHKLNRHPSMKFDVLKYIELNPDVVSNNINPLIHYIQCGKKRGIVASVNKPEVAKESFLNQFFDKIYVVNLAHKVSDRLKVAHHLNQHGINFEIFVATNGYVGEPLKHYQEYSQKELGSLKRYSQYNNREKEQGSLFLSSAGAMGYIYTYIRILLDAKSKGYKRFLILEDDIILIDNFEEKFKNFVKSINDNWKILQLGASQYGWNSVNLAEAEEKGFYLPRTMDTKGSFAIAFDAEIIDELIDAVSSYEAPFDHAPMGELYEKYLGACFVAYPYIIIPDVGGSSIRGPRCQFSHSKRMKWPLEQFDYPLNSPSIAVIIKSKANLKYYEGFCKSNDLPFNLRLYFNTVDGMRPLHNIDLLDLSANEIPPISEHLTLLESDYVVTLDEGEALTESDLIEFIEYKLDLRKENSTSLKEINLISRRIIKDRVSVIIPTYKRPKNLRNALESVLKQDYNDIEIVIVSDNGYGSDFNEETKQIVDSMKCAYPDCNIILLEHSVNRNGSAARNTGIANSTGEFISFLDDDDIYLQGRLSKSINLLKKENKKIGAVYCGFLGWNSPENDLNRYKTGDLTYEILLLDYKKHYLHTNTATYRREAVLNINGFDESYRRHQDLEFNLRFFELYEIAALKECLVRLNPEPSGISNKAFNMAMLDLKLKFLTQFSYLIERFTLEEQRSIYSQHQNESFKYIKEKESTLDIYKSDFRNFNTQIVIKLLCHLNPTPKSENIIVHKKDIGFYRIIGNNIPRLHSSDQSYESIRFIVENESDFDRVDKYFVLNRIIDDKIRTKIIKYLKLKKINYLEIDFDFEEYKKIGYDFKNLPDSRYWFSSRTNWQKLVANAAIRVSKNRYLMNNNGARNFALHHGKERYSWSMPWDGNCFLSDPHYNELQEHFNKSKNPKYVITPMERLSSNDGINNKSISKDATEEPQISFYKDSLESFNEERVYGNQPKVELFKRIGAAGVWDEYVNLFPWKKLEFRKSADFGLVTSSSAVFRLFSGNVAAIESKNRSHTRAEGLADFIDEVETHYLKNNLLSMDIKIRFLSYLDNKLESTELRGLNIKISKLFSSSLTPKEKDLKLKALIKTIGSIYKVSEDSRTKLECILILFARNLSRKGKLLDKDILLAIDKDNIVIHGEESLKNTGAFKQYFYYQFSSMLLKLILNDLQMAMKHKLELAMLMYFYYDNRIECDRDLNSCLDLTLYIFKEFFEYDFHADLKRTPPEI